MLKWLTISMFLKLFCLDKFFQLKFQK